MLISLNILLFGDFKFFTPLKELLNAFALSLAFSLIVLLIDLFWALFCLSFFILPGNKSSGLLTIINIKYLEELLCCGLAGLVKNASISNFPCLVWVFLPFTSISSSKKWPTFEPLSPVFLKPLLALDFDFRFKSKLFISDCILFIETLLPFSFLSFCPLELVFLFLENSLIFKSK